MEEKPPKKAPNTGAKKKNCGVTPGLLQLSKTQLEFLHGKLEKNAGGNGTRVPFCLAHL